MKIKSRLVSVCLIGVTLLSTVPVFGATKSRVPEKPIYLGVESKYSDECVKAEFFCHDFDCPRTLVNAKDFIFIGDESIGDKPSYYKNEDEMDAKFFIQNHMPFTLPVGKITLNEIVGTDKFTDVSFDIKVGVNTYEVVVDGVKVKTPAIKGVSMSNKMGEYSDLKKTHWAYQNISKAVTNGWITPDSATVMGMEKYEKVKSPVSGQTYTQRADSISLQEMYTGINRVFMSNGIYLGNDSSRTDLRKYFNVGGTFGSSVQLDNLFNLSGGYSKNADWLNLCMSTMTNLSEEFTPLMVYDRVESISTSEGGRVDRDRVAMNLHSIVYDMNLPIVNNLMGSEFKGFDNIVVENNHLTGDDYRTGYLTYIISRGLIAPEIFKGQCTGFSGESVGKPEFATILCNLDRAIKAAKTAK